MNGIENISCKLCFKTITDTSFQAINDYNKGILNAVLEMKFESESKQVICKACFKTLNAAFELKGTCLITNNTIISYADSKDMLQVDLREVYMKENGTKELSGMLNDQQVCVLCMQLVENEFRYVQEGEATAVQKFFPEMNINIVKDPIVCHTCFDSLCAHNSFLEQCLENQRNTPLDLFIKTENLDEASEINVTENPIKFEFPEVKSENDSFIEAKKFDIEEIRQMETSVKNEYIKMKPVEEDLCAELISSNEETVNRCDNQDGNVSYMYTCDVKTEHKPNYTNAEFEGNTKYKTKNKILLQKHQSIHKDDPVAQMYNCDVCAFQTKSKEYFRKHHSTHKNPAEIRIYTCEVCNLSTKYRHSFRKHRLMHKDSSEVQIYKCDHCDYETKHKHYLVLHLIKHKDSSQVQMYKCDACDYESKYKKNLTYHQLTHKDSSEVPMYKCKDCEFKTKRKYYLAKHALKHKDSSQVERYKCDSCEFETKYKHGISKHKLMHKDSTEVRTFKCNDCDFVTKYKYNLKSHMLIHNTISNEAVYKCTVCAFETKYKHVLRRHELNHKGKPVSKTYKCDFCEFKTMFSKYLMAHQTSHKISWRRGIYKCTVCSFETEQRHVIAYHGLKHKVTSRDGDIHREATNSKDC